MRLHRFLAFALLAAVAAVAAGAAGCTSAPLRPGDPAAGRELFEARCSHCHELPEPAEYDRVEWRGIIRKMGPQAGLDRQMQEDAYSWVEQHCPDTSSR